VDNLKDSLVFLECMKWTSAIERAAEIIDLTPHAEKISFQRALWKLFSHLGGKKLARHRRIVRKRFS
jgi:hypothetical protein